MDDKLELERNAFLKDKVRSEYPPGPVYSARWLVDCEQAGKLIDKEPYELIDVDASSFNSKKLHHRTRFTIRELIKIFEIVEEKKEEHRNKNKNVAFWTPLIE